MAKNDDPQALRAVIAERDAKLSELNDQVKNLPRERKQFQTAQDAAEKEKKAADEARADLRGANRRIAVLEAELASEQSARASERKLLEAAKNLAAAIKALS